MADVEHDHSGAIQPSTPEGAKKACFVIGPIGSPGSDVRRHADLLFNGVIKEVLNEGSAYRVRRADEVAAPGMITDAVIQDLSRADLVIADLSFLNPNAFYELGIRHIVRVR